MIVQKISVFTGKLNSMEIEMTHEQFLEYTDKKRTRKIQEIFPTLTPDEREFLISGTTSEEWAKFAPEEQD